MTENKAQALPKTTEEAQAKESAQPQLEGPLQTEHGTTTIAESVVQKLAGIAAREVPGVYAMGTAARRAINSLSERIPGSQTNVSGGVSVEKGERQAAIDVSIVVEYGVAIADVAEDIRRSVIQAVEHGTSLEVIEVNVNVTDIHLPEDDDDAASDRSDRLE
ncbi:Asp23/Gls24 family envelope stress response protein [Zhihengliuella halotolerans]|uniref:Putative alkaline shock family protein YloU n=1 Tax=Zhihengliuella halotolerans TaxID=370736 RepID=A0A4Q8AHK3_9MICC|nr:Asp23/Gls24 family envelope stress response protein [Zhihengliuella halotolerans]RZU63263.1 putative alkaline shock family protein YloU [Zhihengliuella halotolerans]